MKLYTGICILPTYMYVHYLIFVFIFSIAGKAQNHLHQTYDNALSLTSKWCHFRDRNHTIFCKVGTIVCKQPIIRMWPFGHEWIV